MNIQQDIHELIVGNVQKPEYTIVSGRLFYTRRLILYQGTQFIFLLFSRSIMIE